MRRAVIIHLSFRWAGRWPLPPFSISEVCAVSNSDEPKQTDAHKAKGREREGGKKGQPRAGERNSRGIKRERNKVREGRVPFPQVHERRRERESRGARYATWGREKREGGRGKEAAGVAAEARSIRSGSRNQVASVDRASHLSIHLSSSTGINPRASVGGGRGEDREPEGISRGWSGGQDLWLGSRARSLNADLVPAICHGFGLRWPPFPYFGVLLGWPGFLSSDLSRSWERDFGFFPLLLLLHRFGEIGRVRAARFGFCACFIHEVRAPQISRLHLSLIPLFPLISSPLIFFLFDYVACRSQQRYC